MAACLHCQKRKGRSRGLCDACHKDPQILAQYPQKVFTRNAGTRMRADETMEELDAMIAEQYRNAGDWFWKDFLRPPERADL